MTTTQPAPGALALAARGLAVRSAGAEGPRALARLAGAGAPVEGCRDPSALARSCHGTGGRRRLEVTVAALSPLVPGDEVATLCLLVAVRPVLGKLARRVERSGAERHDAETAVVAAWLAAVAETRDHATPASLTVLVPATWSRLRADLRRQRPVRDGEVLVASVADGPEPGADPAERVTTLLVDARRRQVVTARQATLLAATRLAGHPVDEVCAGLGLSRAAAWKDRRRAELALAGFVRPGTEAGR